MRQGLQIAVGAAMAAAVPSVGYAQTSGLASVGLGYEDNVVLAPDQLAEDTESGDSFFEILGVGSLAVGRPAGAELSLKGTAYVLDYWDLDRFDLAHLSVGPELKGRSGAWRWWVEASVGRVFLDYDAFEQVATLEGGVGHHLSDRFDWRLSYRHDRITGYQPYDYLSGSKDRFRLTARYRPASWSWEGGYELALNDRDDLTEGDEGGDFSSYSPTRHTLYAEVSSHPGQWDLSLKGEARYSRYNDPHRTTNASNQIVTKTREDTRYRASVRLGRDLGKGVAAFGEVRRTVNDSNLTGASFTDYSYTNTYYMVGLERWF